MSADAKIWKDNEGWHAVTNWHERTIHGSEYSLSDIITAIEDKAKQPLNWEIFEFSNGLGLRGFLAK